MIKLKFFIAMIVLGGAVAVLWLQHSFNEALRRDNEMLRMSVAELKSFQGTPEPTPVDATLTKLQSDELLSLRDEAARLQAQTNRIALLKQVNQQLAAFLRDSGHPKKKRPEDALPQDIHPRESWVYRGFATPEAAIESLAWAIVNGDQAKMLDAFTPENRAQHEAAIAETERRLNDPHFAADEAEFAAKRKGITEFRILDRRQISDDQIVVSLYVTARVANGQNVTEMEKSRLQNIGGEWKVAETSADD